MMYNLVIESYSMKQCGQYHEGYRDRGRCILFSPWLSIYLCTCPLYDTVLEEWFQFPLDFKMHINICHISQQPIEYCIEITNGLHTMSKNATTLKC